MYAYVCVYVFVCKGPGPYSDFYVSFPKQKNPYLLCMKFKWQWRIFQDIDVFHKNSHATVFFYVFPDIWGQENGIPLPCNLK